MPVDSTRIRAVAEKNDKVTERVRETSRRVEGLRASEVRQPDETRQAAKDWVKNVRGLKASLDAQQDLTRNMRETARIQDEQQGFTFRDHYRFVMDRLKADIRYFFQHLRYFVDLPQDKGNWDHCQFDMESELKSVPSHITDTITSLDPLVALLNFRDAVVSLLLNGMLFQRAVLDWDLKSQRAYADKPMVEMYEMVADIFSKTEMVPARLSGTIPSVSEQGPFTFDRRNYVEKGITTELTPVQSRMLTVLREMQSLDKGLRNMKFGQKVNIPDKHKGTTKVVAADELRNEVTKWHNMFQAREQELQLIKSQRHTPLEVQVEQLQQRCAEKENLNKQNVSRLHKLESEMQNLQREYTSMKHEKQELQEKNTRLMKDSLPAITQMEKVLAKSRESVDRLTVDAEMFSAMFRMQVQENKQKVDEADAVREERDKALQALQIEKETNQFKEAELRKKETLYLRTMAARKSIHESYLEQKQRIVEVEQAMKNRENDWQEMLRVLEGRDAEIRQLKVDLVRASQRIDELEQQKKMCLEEYRKETGKNLGTLLERFRPQPTSPPNA